MQCCRIVNGIKNKNIKNSLGAKWNASHLAVRLCALRHWKRVSMPPTTQSLRHPLTRAIHFAPRIKTARRFTAKNPLMIKWILGKMQYYNYGRTWSITTDPLRGSYCVRIAITKLRSIALRLSFAWCFESFGISDACLSCCFSFPHGFSIEP